MLPSHWQMGFTKLCWPHTHTHTTKVPQCCVACFLRTEELFGTDTHTHTAEHNNKQTNEAFGPYVNFFRLGRNSAAEVQKSFN